MILFAAGWYVLWEVRDEERGEGGLYPLHTQRSAQVRRWSLGVPGKKTTFVQKKIF